MDKRARVIDPVYTCVVGGSDPDNQIRMVVRCGVVQGTQNLRQLVRAELARSTGSVAVCSESLLCHSDDDIGAGGRVAPDAMGRPSLHPPSAIEYPRPMVNRRIAVIGGGTMGIGIAHRFAANGFGVEVADIDLSAAQASVDRVRATLDTAAERGKLTDASAAKNRLSAVGSVDDIAPGAVAVVEAVVEDAGLKKRILRQAERSEPEVLASNTSSISIDDLATALERPGRFIGMHFFNPVWVIDLVEVVRGAATTPETESRVSSLVEALGMQQATINDAPGFATSRLGVLVGLEAVRMVEQGVADPADIDRAMTLGYRHPMGPLMLGDLVGHDVRLGIARHLASVYGERFEPPQLLIDMVDEGRLGKKAGRGFYDWTSGSAEPIQKP